MDVTARLQTLTLDYRLEAEVQSRLESFLNALAEAGKHAPTTVSSPERAVDAHVADALSALDLPAVREARHIADLGAGAGVPGLVLAAALPHAEVRLIESQQSKCVFIARLAAAMGLRNAEIVCTRVEDWASGVSASDIVTARALAPQPVVLEYAAPLLQRGGRLIDWRGLRRAAEEAAAERAAQQLGLQCAEIRRVHPFPGAEDHHLHAFEKVADTPARFPRRAGVAMRKPLAAA